jgi:molecular chaperone DnaJ
MNTDTKDYYSTLGVKKDATQDEIKKSYRRLARKHHPDLNHGNKESESRFKEINEAYEVLGDQAKRAEYDAYGGSPFNRGGASPFNRGGRGGSPFGQSAAGGFEGANGRVFNGGFGDMFGDIFGFTRSAAETRGARGQDYATSLTLTLEEAFSGVTKTINIKRNDPCPRCGGEGADSTRSCIRCGGSGRLASAKGFYKYEQNCPECNGAGKIVIRQCVECGGRGTTSHGESLKIKIPMGVDTGSRVRLRGKGAPGHSPGDVIIEVTVEPHRVFKRKGDDLYADLRVTFPEATLGARVEVPTPDGSAVMTLPEGTNGGMVFKLKGKGMTSTRGERGDLFAEVKIIVPKGLSAHEKELVKKVAALYKEESNKDEFKDNPKRQTPNP